MGGPVFLYLQLLSADAMLYSRASALYLKSFLPRDGLTRVNIAVRRTARAAKYAASFHIFCSSERKMNGISNDNLPFEIPILAYGIITNFFIRYLLCGQKVTPKPPR